MPRIFDNIEQSLLPTLRDTLQISQRADFCVGYFNLRGWRKIDDLIEQFSGTEGACCRLLVGMQRLPKDEVREALAISHQNTGIDNSIVIRCKRQIAQEFCEQLTWGAPTNDDEAGLRTLCRQIKSRKVIVKLFLRHPLHAKLYLVHRTDVINPSIGFLGSSNLTLSGLQHQGELNVDVLDHDACHKLQKWFDDRWDDRWCIDISQELVDLIDESWAREKSIPPYHIYLKIAYHLSQEARAGLLEYQIPRDFSNQLFDFQKAAVQIAARHVNRRGGVLVGDVVGLGKTLIASALAKILEEDFFLETLIICPKNLVTMWEDYVHRYGLKAKVLSISRVQNELPNERRYRVVLIDESHNLRNREGKRYRAIQEYIALNESRCILLTATPYNKTYLDLSNQLRLFVPEDKNLGIRPEKLLSELGGEIEFTRRHQAAVRSLAAFEKSEYPDDWRELMRLYMVRRTRSFIQDNYAKSAPPNLLTKAPVKKGEQDSPLLAGDQGFSEELGERSESRGRKYLEFPDGTRSYFPLRRPWTVKFSLGEDDAYAALYSEDVVKLLNALNLPRYGLGNYAVSAKTAQGKSLTLAESQQLKGLSRAGKRLMGFCRTNLFKRLESGGPAFLKSLDRHILRNYIFLYAIAQDLPLPIGSQEAALLDTRNNDEDLDSEAGTLIDPETDEAEELTTEQLLSLTEADYRRRAAVVYQEYATRYFRFAEQYQNQVPIINGKRHGKDVNLYKLFLEQCCNLLKLKGKCGLVIPSGIYTDLGAKKLREVLFNQTQITGLFCFENRKGIFEGVDSRFKFVILTFEKNGITQKFPVKFMRHDVQELERFPGDDSLYISVEQVRKLSPDSLSVMEFKDEIDCHIAEKMTTFPLLGEKNEGKWNLELHREFNMTDDASLFHQKPDQGMLPLFTGRMLHQTFPIVPEATKQAALEAYKTFTPLTGDPEIIELITQGESAELEFKSSARWDMRENKQNKVMEEVILKAVAGFLNSYPGGTLLIGIDDEGKVLGLNHDYQTFKKKNRDGYELFLINDLLLKELGKDLAPYIHITFHEVEGKDICRIILDPSPRPAYIKLKDPKSGQTKECLFIRTGNLTSQLDTPSNIHNYCKNCWS